MELIITALYILFVLSAIVLVVVILLQEGKGGGLTDALGTSGQQTFGVGASGINKFTGWMAAVFLVSAVGIHWLNREVSMGSVVNTLGTPQITSDPAGGSAPTGAPTEGGTPSTPPPTTPNEPPK